MHDDVSTTVSILLPWQKQNIKLGLKKSNYTIYTNVTERLDSKSNHVIDRILKLSELFNLKIDYNSVSVRFYPTDVEI